MPGEYANGLSSTLKSSSLPASGFSASASFMICSASEEVLARNRPLFSPTEDCAPTMVSSEIVSVEPIELCLDIEELGTARNAAERSFPRRAVTGLETLCGLVGRLSLSKDRDGAPPELLRWCAPVPLLAMGSAVGKVLSPSPMDTGELVKTRWVASDSGWASGFELTAVVSMVIVGLRRRDG
jgi:hypothetical protein